MSILIFAILLFVSFTALGCLLLFKCSLMLLERMLCYVLVTWYQDAALRASLVAQVLSVAPLPTTSMEMIIKEQLSAIIGAILHKKMAMLSTFVPQNWKEEVAQATVRHLQETYPYAFGVPGARFPESIVHSVGYDFPKKILKRHWLRLLTWSGGIGVLLTILVLILQVLGNLISK